MTPFNRSRFSVWAHFYRLKLGSWMIDCRSRAEILRISNHSMPDSRFLAEAVPDLVFILLNPGSCQPNDVDRAPAHRQPDQEQIFGNPSQTLPDRTQLQLMQLLDMLHLNHGRLLNLSDICESCSVRFAKTLRLVQSHREGHSHSIFSSSRRASLQPHLHSRFGLAVVGWGARCACLDLATRCLEQLAQQGVNVVGQPHAHNPIGYYHPLPRSQSARDEWLRGIDGQLGQTRSVALSGQREISVPRSPNQTIHEQP